MLQSISSVFVVYRHKTLTGSRDPTHANGVNKPCTDWFNFSDNDPLSDREWELKAKSRKQDHISPEVVVMEDDEPLSNSKHKTLVKKPWTYTVEEQNAIDRLHLRLKSDCQACQYNKETARLTKYH